VRAVPGSSIPILAPLALHDDAGGIADFDPDTAQAGSIGGIHPWRKSEIFGSQSRVGGNCCSQPTRHLDTQGQRRRPADGIRPATRKTKFVLAQHWQ
jgi:hypothetical protein